MKKIILSLVAIFAVIIIVVVVRSNRQEQIDSTNFVIGQAMVSDATIALRETFPVDVMLDVSGTFPDGCTELSDIIQTRDETTGEFVVLIQTKRPLDAMCTQALVDFQTSIMLQGTEGLPAGEYMVRINDLNRSFMFDIDNRVSDFDPLK
jgi:inhibitor of cysteine peptidase